MAFLFKGQSFSADEIKLACASDLYAKISEDTLSSITGFRRGGPGAPAVPCYGLVHELQRSQHAAFTTVASNPAYWEPRAREEYRRWLDINSQIVQRLRAEDKILPYL
ncbi:hypothetical protein ABVK25_011589 [Lepraria finkii]|uniref:Uncharacterized protein n=1 Tax=Lepraria finkii TaxID=1340010 RepID=A0ABR4ALV4_9LECA